MGCRLLFVTAVLVSIPGASLADDAAPPEAPPFAQLHTQRTACLEPGMTDCVRLGPGYFLDDATYASLDGQVRALQDAQTRLQAENESLRVQAKIEAAAWHPGFYTLLAASVLGAATAIYVEHKLK